MLFCNAFRPCSCAHAVRLPVAESLAIRYRCLRKIVIPDFSDFGAYTRSAAALWIWFECMAARHCGSPLCDHDGAVRSRGVVTLQCDWDVLCDRGGQIASEAGAWPLGRRRSREFIGPAGVIEATMITAMSAPWFELAVIHHTDCGPGLMADDQLRAGFVARGFDDRQLQHNAVIEPATTVAHDVRRIVESPVISNQIEVSGYSYDVKTGRLTEVVGSTRAGARS
jgi:hypothetical protein